MNEESLFHLALEKPAHERAAFLDSACAGNAEMRHRIERLLKAHDNPDSFLREPALPSSGASPSEATQAFAADAAKPTDGPKTESERSCASDEDLAFLAPSTRPDVLGRMDHYHVLEVIGKGGFGTVLKAFDEKLHRVVAIKVLSVDLSANGTARQRFIREARTAAAVTHEHVVTIHAVVEEHRPPYLVMQMIDGVTLQQKLDNTGPLSLREILRIGLQMAEGLAAAHKQGLVHRDIKPANILLENGVERVKITDFGLAKVADDASVTQSGVVAGTPMYMSPEQANGEQIDYRSDLFSLGTVLYVMCTGRPPFRATGTLAVLKRVIDDTPRPVREINPEIPDWLEAIITKLHAKKPQDRYQTAKEVAEVLGQRLAEVQAGRAGSESDRSEPAKTPVVHAPSSPRPWRRALAVATILLVLLAGAAYLRVPGLGRYLSNQTSLQFRANSEEAKLLVRKDGEQVALLSNAGEINLPPGMYAFEIQAPASMKVQGCTASEYAWTGSWMGNLDFTESVFEPIGLDEPRPVLPRLKGHNMMLARGRQVVFSVNGFAARDRDDSKVTEPGWVQLFDGTTFDGFHFSESKLKNWKVENNVIVGKSDHVADYLMTRRDDYQDFHLRVEAKINKGGNSGVFFRRDATIDHPGRPGYEVELNTLSLANINKPDSRFFSLAGSLLQFPKAPTVLHSEKRELIQPDTWFTIDVIAQGSRIITKINGQTTADVTDDKHQRGRFEFQLYDGDTVLHIKKIEIKEFSSAAAPFVILAKEKRAEALHATLAEAVKAAQSGDIIEIRGDGPFESMPIDLGKKALTICAGAGYRPHVKHQPIDPESKEPLLLTWGPLVLEGLTLERGANPEAVDWVNRGSLITVWNSAVRLANCRLIARRLFAGVELSTSDGVITNCEFLGYDGCHAYVAQYTPVSSRLVLENNLVAGQWDMLGLVVSRELDTYERVAVNLRNNTIRARFSLGTHANFNPETPLLGDGKWDRIRMETSGNILSGEAAFLFEAFGKTAALENPVSLLHKLLSFRDEDNLYHLDSQGKFLETLAQDRKPFVRSIDSLEAWHKAWGIAKSRSRVGSPVFVGGADILKPLAAPADVSPTDFRLAPGSPGKGAGPGGKDLGADIDLVGPGEAYEKWKKTQEYQEWRKQADALMGVALPFAVAPFEAAKAREHQDAWAKFLGVEVEITNSLGMKLACIPPGQFTMGSPENEPERELEAKEGPQHKVMIRKPFLMGVYEVTQGEYEKLMGDNPSAHKKSLENPVESVLWKEADEFCKKLSELAAERQAGRQYRLPTEAEWEYACRAGTTTIFSHENSLSSKQANFDGQKPYPGAQPGPAVGMPVKVGSYKANAWGLHDMHGNVWEWCLDSPRTYDLKPVDDPKGATGPGAKPLLRGGSYEDIAANCRSAARYPFIERMGDGRASRDLPARTVGFRVVCELSPEKLNSSLGNKRHKKE